MNCKHDVVSRGTDVMVVDYGETAESDNWRCDKCDALFVPNVRFGAMVEALVLANDALSAHGTVEATTWVDLKRRARAAIAKALT